MTPETTQPTEFVELPRGRPVILRLRTVILQWPKIFGRKGIAWMEKEAPGLRHEYTGALVLGLRFHAQVLQELNRPDKAQKRAR